MAEVGLALGFSITDPYVGQFEGVPTEKKTSFKSQMMHYEALILVFTSLQVALINNKIYSIIPLPFLLPNYNMNLS